MEGVEVIFGLPGGAILPVYDPIIDSPIRHVLVRHEQGAGHMAEGYAHATGKPGVAMVTSGPGATNIVTPLADAYMDSVPMVVHHRPGAHGVDRHRRLPGGRHHRHHPVGHQAQLPGHRGSRHPPRDPRGVPHRHHRSARARCWSTSPRTSSTPPTRARPWSGTGPPTPRSSPACPATSPPPRPPPQDQGGGRADPGRRAPVIYAGGGILKARAAEALRELAELLDLPVVTTLMARGAFPDDHPLCLGMPGMHGNYTAIMSMQEIDLLIALGSRFDDRVTGKVPAFAPLAKIIHVDIDPAELGKVRRPDVPIVGDCNQVIVELVKASCAPCSTRAAADITPWRSTLSGWQETYPLAYEQPEEGESAQAADGARGPAGLRPRGLHRGQRRRPAPDVDQPVLEVPPPLHLDQLRRPRHHGLLGPGGHRRQGRPPRPHGLGHRRRRLLPDDRPGAGDRGGRAHPGEDRHLEQRLPGHGPPVAGDVLRGAVLRGVPLAGPARLREVGRGHGLRGVPGGAPRRHPAHHRQGQRHRRPSGGHRVPHRRLREGLPDGGGRHSNSDVQVPPFQRPAGDTTGRSSSDHPDRGRAPPPDPVGPGGEQGRRARTRRQPVLPSGLQHLLPGRGAHRRRALQPTHRGGRRGVGTRSSRSSSSSTSSSTW
jgi:hypothetical protein